MYNQPIGILDSGVGGLSLWQEIVSQLPHESTIYLADSQNCPYGTRDSDEIYSLAKRLAKFLIDKKVKLIVIACNTITVTSLRKLREVFPKVPMVGIVPVIKTAAELTKKKKIGVLSTHMTAKSRYQRKLIETFAQNCEVITVGTDTLVPFVERGEVESETLRKILSKELASFIGHGIDVLALGCSHFPFLRGQMQEVLGSNVLLLDSAGAIARQVGRVLVSNNSLSKGKATHQFFTTGDVHKFRVVSTKLIGGTIAENVQHVRF